MSSDTIIFRQFPLDIFFCPPVTFIYSVKLRRISLLLFTFHDSMLYVIGVLCSVMLSNYMVKCLITTTTKKQTRTKEITIWKDKTVANSDVETLQHSQTVLLSLLPPVDMTRFVRRPLPCYSYVGYLDVISARTGEKGKL